MGFALLCFALASVSAGFLVGDFPGRRNAALPISNRGHELQTAEDHIEDEVEVKYLRALQRLQEGIPSLQRKNRP